MQTPKAKIHAPASKAARRRAIEAIIARYPDVTDDNLKRIFDYFRRESSSLDRRLIAANRGIRPQFRRLCQDHQVHRLPFIDVAVALLGAVALVVGIIYFVVAP